MWEEHEETRQLMGYPCPLLVILFLGGFLMKKTLVSALAAALVVGAASTTFAAANPFSDVPSDHWAYDAVAQLAKDGVIEGYGDSSYRGGQNITRYEMAQMVARAMAKNDVSAADKAMIDKLAAEFSDELNNLGVRVENLEKKTDNVKWTGEARWKYASMHRDDDGSTEGSRTNNNQFLFRLEPSAQVNEHWAAKARIDYYTSTNDARNLNSAGSGSSDNKLEVPRMWAEGAYGNTTIKLGKLPFFSNLDQGMVMDDNLSGAQVTFGKELKTTISAGRFNGDNVGYFDIDDTKSYNTGSVQSVELLYDNGGKLTGGAAYYNMNGVRKAATLGDKEYGTDKAGIWELGLGYKFTPNFAMYGNYAKNSKGNVDAKYRQAYSIEADYKAADPQKKGSFGLFVAYRHLGTAAVLAPTYDAMAAGYKGWTVGGAYTFTKNIMGTVKYFKGKSIATKEVDTSLLFGQMEFFF